MATVPSSPSPVPAQGLVTVTATSTGLIQTDPLRIKDGPTTLDKVVVFSGVATFSNVFNSGGSHILVATFAGDSSNRPSVSAAFVQDVSYLSPTTTLSLGTGSASTGQAVLISAGRSAPSGAGGPVSFMAGATVVRTIPVTSSPSSLQVFDTAGTHNLTAVHSGDAATASSTSSFIAKTITPGPSTVYLSPAVSSVAVAGRHRCRGVQDLGLLTR